MTFLTDEQQKLLGSKYSIEQLQTALEELQFQFSMEEYKKKITTLLSKSYPPYLITCMTEEAMRACDNMNR